MQRLTWRHLDGNRHESMPVPPFAAAAPVVASELRESPIL
ncbi:hypothetical protein PAMC26577_29880 [Caballeronia sordidicola]|uniref:Uncharacterized protein n=1 Tax=Caballeronia sordidicola TaxID=196367 RepID=A0A242MG53_CABSO|nr:hypothetical protein PAMC26577_29880 [Caballeronia sordidicola]